MSCDSKVIPAYLHWATKKTYKQEDFYYFHKLYRIKSKGNPIDIPAQWLTAISCKWSRLIKKKHILIQPEKKIGDDYDFVFIKEVKKYERKDILRDNHEFKGVHKLSCVIIHKPEPCDYSHSEILIRHRIYREEEIEPFFDETYSYESWAKETALLKKSNARFFKDLKKDFRVDMIKLISRNSPTNTIRTNLKSFLNIIDWRIHKYDKTQDIPQ